MRQQQKTPLGPSVLNCDHHESFDQLLKNNLRQQPPATPSSPSPSPAAEQTCRSWWQDARTPVQRLQGNVHRVAAPCHRRPNADNNTGRSASTHGRSSRSRAPSRTEQPLHGRWLRSGQSLAHGMTEWPFRIGARHLTRDLQCARSPPRPVLRGPRNSRGNSPPRPRAACGGWRVPPDTGAAARTMQSRTVLPARARPRKGIQPTQKLPADRLPSMI